MILGSDTVTVLRGRTRDGWGNLQGSDTGTDVTGCSVQPAGGAEQTDRGEAVQTNLTAFLPAGTDILATDRVQWRGKVYAVNGPPAPWDHFGLDYTQVQLALKEGQA